MVEIFIVSTLVWVGLLSYARDVNKSLTNAIILKFEHIQARQEAERSNKEKSRFIAAASHDIRQPLQAINLFVGTLKSRNTQSQDDVLFDRLEKSVDSMSELLNSLLDVSKLDAHVIVPHPQHLLLETVLLKIKNELQTLAALKGIKIEIEAEHCIIFADIILLEQVLNNLMSNAIRYTNNGSITLTASQTSGHITIGIKDTGIGIAAEEQDSIYLEFYQLHNPERDQSKGLGLGLSIVKRLCDLQSWPLSMTSTLGEGSCFSFNIPQGKEESIVAPEQLNFNKKLDIIDAIIIDDNKDIRYSLTNTLNDWDCQVRAFESADNAFEALKSQPQWKPNLIISDYRLRNNVTGLAAIERINALFETPIEAIILSGDTAPERIKEAEDSGFTILHKPIKPAKLRIALAQKIKHSITMQ